MPSSINQIPKRTFDGCQQLFASDDLSHFNKDFLKNIVTIGEYAFNGAAMKNTVIYEKTTSIGDKAFALYGNLIGKHIKLIGGKSESNGLNYDSCGSDIFSGRNLTLQVDMASKYYNDDRWKDKFNVTGTGSSFEAIDNLQP